MRRQRPIYLPDGTIYKTPTRIPRQLSPDWSLYLRKVRHPRKFRTMAKEPPHA
jgi:hypothetical protein